MFAHRRLLGAAVIASTASAALAANELQIDVNSLTTQVMAGADAGTPDMYNSDSGLYSGGATRGSAFGTTFTGSIAMFDDATSVLAGVLIDGADAHPVGTLANFTGQIDFVNGGVAGGFIQVDVLESDAVTVNTYFAQIQTGAGAITTQAGQGFKIDGLTFMGMFSSSTFAGVDVTQWDNAEPLSGSFLQFKFNPDQNGTDIDSDIDIFVVVPMPTAPALAGVGLFGVFATTRRRRLG